MERWAGCVQRSRTTGVERGVVVGEVRLLTVDECGVGEEQIYCTRRHRGAAGAETPETFVMSIVFSCGNGDRKRWRTELDFGGSESFDDHHGAQHIEDSAKDLSHHRRLKNPGRSAALTSKGVTENRAAMMRRGAGWLGIRNYEYAQTSWGAGAAGSGVRIRREEESATFVRCCERSRASGK